MPREPPVTKKIMRSCSGREALDQADAIDPAEPERVLHEDLNVVIHGLPGADVKVHVRVELADVDGWVETPGIHLQDRGYRLHHRRRPAGMAEHRLGGVQLEPVRVLAEGALDRADLGQVAEWRGGGVGADVIDLARLDLAAA